MEEAEMRRAIEMSKAMVKTSSKADITLVETCGKEEGEITLVEEGEQDVVNTRPLVLCSPAVMDISDDSEEEYFFQRPRVVLFINSKVLCSFVLILVHCSQMGPYFRDRVPIGTFLTFWFPIYISGSLFSVFWLNSRKECQFSLHVHNNE